MKTADLPRHIKHLRELEADNQHPEWLVYYATHLAKDRRIAKAAEALLTLQMHFGELTDPLRTLRYEIYKQAKYAFEQRDPVGFRLARTSGV